MNMVERVARALCAASGKDPDGVDLAILPYPSRGSSVSVLPRHAWQDHVDVARAAIEAMREPAPAIEIIAETSTHEGREVWYALIDAALAETP